MAVKHILLPLTGDPASADAARCALTLAVDLRAHVTAGYEDELGPLYVAPDVAGAAFSYAVLYEQMQKTRHELKGKARTHFDRAVAEIKIPIVSAPACTQGSAMWIDSQGDDGAPVMALGGLADLVVMGAPGNRIAPAAWNLLEETLFGARRTALIVPPAAKTVDFSKVLLAWNGSTEAANVTERMIDLLPQEAKVTVLQVGQIKEGRMHARQVMDYLGWHCVDAELRQAPDVPHATSTVILEEARRVGAGCIAMGAYTHSRARQLLLGGVTDYMLRNPSLPMLMAH